MQHSAVSVSTAMTLWAVDCTTFLLISPTSTASPLASQIILSLEPDCLMLLRKSSKSKFAVVGKILVSQRSKWVIYI